MALIQGNMAPQGAPMQQQQVPGASAQVVERIVAAAMTLLNNDTVEQQIVQMVSSSPDPAQGVAQAAVFIMKALHEKSKGTLPSSPEAFLRIIAEIIKIAKAAGIIKEDDPQLIDQVLEAASQLGGEEQPQGQPMPQGQPQPMMGE
jgi:hypothetical protein